jgi:hypothetical protein
MPKQLFIHLNVDWQILCDAWGSPNRFKRQNRWVHLNLAGYGRPGIAGLTTYTPSDAIRLLSVRGVVSAARQLNLDLMRKGPTSHWRTHCFDLADLALAQTETNRSAAA